MKKKKNTKGLFWIFGGLLLMAAALLLIGYNYMDAYYADLDAQFYENVLHKDIDQFVAEQQPTWELDTEEDEYGKPMPVASINDDDYIGILTVPEYGLQLPVMMDWDYKKLKKAPCRYTGSYYDHNLVICGHNYAKHFSPLKWIPEGSEIRFLTVDGTLYHYEVAKVETMPDTAVERMVEQTEENPWDLTLFTCTTGGQARCAVRCRQTGRDKPSYIIND